MAESHNIFSKISPTVYAEVSVLARLIGENMISRLELVTLQPQVILDIGCGTGYCTQLLKQHYPNAKIIALDNEENMLRYMQTTSKENLLCADALRLPIKTHSVDLIFANLLLPWCNHWEVLFAEWQRILRPDGLLLFSCFGVDTLKEFEKSQLQPLIFKDMHEIGDALMQAQFSDPVMDVEYLTVNYREQTKLIHELIANGLLKTIPSLNISSVTYEIVYGHAWGSTLNGYSADESGIVKIPLSHLRKK